MGCSPVAKVIILRLEIQNIVSINVMSPPEKAMYMYHEAKALEDMYNPSCEESVTTRTCGDNLIYCSLVPYDYIS
jgi:hypothetical protein